LEIVIIGVGQFGSALAQIYEANQGTRVFRVNENDAWPTLAGTKKVQKIVIICVPTQALPTLIAQRAASLKEATAIISTAKGLVRGENLTATQFLQKKLKSAPPLFALSGPSFATELKAGQPTALVLAGKHTSLDRLAKALTTTRLRLYKSTDPTGVEICGAFKNIYAIAAGIAGGLGFQDNARAALITRALAEMSRIGKSLGGKPLTFFGLAGVGDLVLTCSSPQSRNYRFGLGLAQGRSTEELVKELGTIEGLWTTEVAHKLCIKKKIRAPILDTINAIVNKHIEHKDALTLLMTRELRHEFD
jgi:glycerol-3-phosphate dehydrogenase (NAD(P)+)